MKPYIITIARIAAWLLTIAIVMLSLVPPWLRPETDVPHDLEHFVIFFVTGAAFGLGYSPRSIFGAGMLVIFAGTIELAQKVVSGRHARMSDFVVDALAACVGFAIASIVAARTLDRGA